MGVQHKRGARAERAAARFLGGARSGNLGRAAADVTVGAWCVVEVKERVRLPFWIKAALGQAEAAAAGCVTPPLPILQLHELGGRIGEDLVVMRAAAFREWFGDWENEDRGDPAIEG